ncbi:alpha/beta hydrolase [uncultured Thermomonospora sp.]|uniref:alpha/beta hydrolase n=1 Tax=uncultured Thermomonospora sp. TaxID=671175 RepID=UPI00259B882F|nr:alpha/beta hydrolase [uncultured Thermomonospora sp.]
MNRGDTHFPHPRDLGGYNSGVLTNPPSRKAAGLLAGAALGGALLAVPAAAQAHAPSIAWRPCPAHDPHLGDALKGLECARLSVPLDHTRPNGRRITLALTRARHTAARFRGAVLLNRGGPGAAGRDLPALFTRALPKDVAASYDWIGFDPRGVGASRPALVCDTWPLHRGRARPDTVPRSRAAERELRKRAKRFADACARKYRDLLPYMGTRNWVEDLEAIRVALGHKKISYFGYSYGTYLGAAYATAYPGRVRRMVLDSVVRPSGVWYANNLAQNVAFEKRIRAFFGWVARHDGIYRLGGTAREVERAYYAVRRKVTAKPIGGRIGPAELDEIFLTTGYSDLQWGTYARALSDYAVRGNPGALRALWKAPDRDSDNTYTMYLATECRDAAWPRDWSIWRRDAKRQYRAGNRFETWNNIWYNAPCAYWRAPGGPPPRVGRVRGVPPILLVHATEDAATPYPGALETHRLLPSSRLVVQRGGGNHGLSLGGDRCINQAVVAYLRSGALPPGRRGVDLTCPAPPPPAPDSAASRARSAAPPSATSARTS